MSKQAVTSTKRKNGEFDSDSDECIPAWAAESESRSSSKSPVKDAFSALMGPRKRSGEEVEEEARIWGVIYCITLTGVPRDHSLFGIVYIGQAIRCHAKSALEAAEMRWKQEVGDSKKHNKQMGLLWALEEFGEAAFRFEVIESKFAPKSELSVWADEREVALIAEHGGVLKDQNKRCWQTLNIQPGGQNARGRAGAAMWKVVRAKLLDRFKTEMEAYAKEHDSSLVRRKYVTPGKYKLGEKLHDFRQGTLRDGMPDKEATEKWAEALPKWAWDARETEEYHEALSNSAIERAANEPEGERADRARKARDNETEKERADRLAKITATMNKPENRAAQSKRASEWMDNETAKDKAARIDKITATMNKPENRAANSKRAIERAANETEEDKAKRIAKTTAAMNKPEYLEAQSKRSLEQRDNETEKERADRLAKAKATMNATTDATLVGLTGKELESRKKAIARSRRADAKRAAGLLLYQAVKPGATREDMRRARSEGWKPP